MKVIPFQRSEHLNLINTWANDRGLPLIEASSLPRFGLLAINESRPVAAMFLYGTDSDIAFFENLIADKETRPEDRQAATVKLIEGLSNIAQENGYKLLIARTDFQTVGNNFMNQHFVAVAKNCSIYVRSI
jgi:hypothetical protein